jgi:hypothetical protein
MKAELPDDLLSVLKNGVPALVMTVDADGFPHTGFSFAATRAKDSLAVVVDEGSSTQKNIERTKQASAQILANDNRVYLLKGSVSLREKLKHSPAPSRRAVIQLSAVKNQAWQQVRVSPLTYEYSERAREWESALPRLYAELRGEG